MSDRRVLGIDLGTTNTCVAHVRNKVPKVVPSDKGRLVLPSVVGLSERGSLVVGNVAKEQMVTRPQATIYGHKRFIGRPFNSPYVRHLAQKVSYEIVEGKDAQVAVRLGDRVMELPEVSSLLLDHIRIVADQFLGGPAEDTVISVPAYYNDNQRAAVKRSGELAGLKVRRIINEPTAAALAYGFNRGFNQKILVFDLGGGTFDVSVLEVEGNVFQVVATGGDTFLGGVDFDERIIDYVLEEFKREHRIDLSNDLVVLQRIRNAAETAKMDLSLLSNVVITLPYVTDRKGRPIDLRLPLSRSDLDGLTKDLVDRAFLICDKVLASKGLSPHDMDEIILVGGQTRMPLVQTRIQEHFGRPARKGVHPEECVALGAALLADSLDQIDAVTLIDVLGMPIGIAAPGGRFKKVIDRNVTVPYEKSLGLPKSSSEDGVVELDIFQGDSDKIIDNEYLGSVRFPRGVERVTFRLDEEGILQLSVVEPGGARRNVNLATQTTPPSLKLALEEEMERQRLAAESSGSEQPREGLFASIRRVLGRG